MLRTSHRRRYGKAIVFCRNAAMSEVPPSHSNLTGARWRMLCVDTPGFLGKEALVSWSCFFVLAGVPRQLWYIGLMAYKQCQSSESKTKLFGRFTQGPGLRNLALSIVADLA